jgi:DNA-binding YbaB/EbfC family protein
MTDQPMDMFGQIQRMQADMQAARDALANALVDATAGGGVVKATVTGDGELRAIKIDPSVVDPDDVEMLEDLVFAAVTEAMLAAKKLQAERLGAATGGLDIDSLMGGLGGLLGPGTE